MRKIVETRKLYKDTVNEVTKNSDNWMAFLDSSSWNFKYDFDDQILIYAQRPDARACASMEEWNNKVRPRRWVNKGADYIFVQEKDENRQFPFRLVFDISDTHNSQGTEYKLWEIKPEYEQDVIETLETSFGEVYTENEGNKTLAQTIYLSSYNLIEDNIQDYMQSLKKHKKGTNFENMTDDEIETIMKVTATASVSYMIMTRCGINPKENMELQALSYVNYFDSYETVTVLGSAVSDIAEMALREIAKAVRNLQMEEKNKNHTFVRNKQEVYDDDKEKIKGGIENERDNLHETGRLQRTELDNDNAEDTNREIFKNEIQLSKEAQESRIDDIRDGGEIDRTLDRSAKSSNEENRADSREYGETRGDNRRNESQRPDEMGTNDEQLEVDSRGTSSQRTNLYLEPLTEEEQKQKIAEVENASVFAFTQEMIDNVLQSGSGFEDGKFRIYEQFSKQLTNKENADFLKQEYGIGGSSIENDGWVDYNATGIILSNKTTKLTLSWIQVEKRIKELISCDRYLSKIEKDQYNDWLDTNGIRNHEVENSIHDEDYEVAKRLHTFIKDYDLYAYMDSGAMESTDEENIEIIRADINDGKNIKDYIEFLKSSYEDEDYDDELTVEARQLIVELENRLPYYEFHSGDIVCIGIDEYEIRTIDDNRAILVDTSFPILTKEMSREEFDKKVKENPANDKLRTGKRIQDKIENVSIVDEKQQEQEIEQVSSTEVKQQTKEKPYKVGDTVYLESDRKYKIDTIDLEHDKISLLDTQINYPIFREENILTFENLYYQNERNHLKEDIKPKFTRTTNKIQDFILHPEVAESNRNNYKITNDNLGVGKPKEKFVRNIEAIKVLKKCESENRYATPEEQEILSKYIGWGGLQQVFNEHDTSWSNEYHILKDLLTEEEYKQARSSVLTAFYTPPIVIRSIYQALQNMGLKEANILEPSCGVGNFLGMLPSEIENCKMYGIEIDSITGRIAQQLYQKSTIAVQGYEKVELPDSFFDVAVGNVPFENQNVNDKRYSKNNFVLHDYFFAKTLDKVRPNGVIVFITSKGTMDKKNSNVRKYIAQRAELLGAIRLPNNTFSKNAGTEVTSDIIFLKKRERMTDIMPEWVNLGTDNNGIVMNQYFVDNPNMILGKMEMDKRQYGREDSTCKPYDGIKLEDLLNEAIENISGEIEDFDYGDIEEEEVNTIPADPSVKNFSYTIVDGKIYFRENSVMIEQDLPVTTVSRIKGMIELRDCVRNLIELQTQNFPEENIKVAQEKLNRLYDNYVKKYDRINSRGNNLAFSEDSSYYLLCSLEVLDSDGKFLRKADMFTKRTINAYKEVTSVDTSNEALIVSLSEKARVDLEYMSKLTNKTQEEIITDLEGLIFKVPMENEKYVTADEYLSGNIREKLKLAESLVETQPEFEVNVKALKEVMPKDLTATEISVKLGATWIPIDVVEQFIYELLNTSNNVRDEIKVKFSNYNSEWYITHKNYDYRNVKVNKTYGTNRLNAYEIIEKTLNLKDIRVYDTIEHYGGKKERVFNAKETAIAQGRQEQIKQEFLDWIWKDQERRNRLVRLYNDKFNSIRPREYDGSHLKFAGMNPEIALRKHQLNAIAHGLYGGNTLLAHEVGAGKTFEMIAIAMESKRLGLCNKSLFVVPNHILEQFASEFLQLYPSANIMVATKKDFMTANRKKFCSRIATGDFDAILIGHSQFEKIPISFERQQELICEQINSIISCIDEAKRDKAENFTIKQMEKVRKSLESKLEKLNDQSRKDDVITFEELGVDKLIVDEAHRI